MNSTVSDPENGLLRSSVGYQDVCEAGGYMSLALPDFGEPFKGRLHFQSARAALRYFLEKRAPRHVLLPAFICDSVVAAIRDAGCSFSFYLLDKSLFPVAAADYSDAFFLYVNYFGLNDNNVERLLQERPRELIIIDNSQALFASPKDVAATVYSPRKYLGVPDGGLLVSSASPTDDPVFEDLGSIDRMRHLLIRSAYSANYGYHDFIAAEQSLNDTTPLSMSLLTRRLLRSIDLEAVMKRRQQNFEILSGILSDINIFQWSLSADIVPLCYPFLPVRRGGAIKKSLLDRKIYVPTYWSESRSRVKPDTIESLLVEQTVYLPVDQRMTSQQTHFIGELVRKLSRGAS